MRHEFSEKQHGSVNGKELGRKSSKCSKHLKFFADRDKRGKCQITGKSVSSEVRTTKPMITRPVYYSVFALT